MKDATPAKTPFMFHLVTLVMDTFPKSTSSDKELSYVHLVANEVCIKFYVQLHHGKP